jgi:hypothetical protein
VVVSRIRKYFFSDSIFYLKFNLKKNIIFMFADYPKDNHGNVRKHFQNNRLGKSNSHKVVRDRRGRLRTCYTQ